MAVAALPRRHWIYVLGGRELRVEAHRWQRSKSAAGKSYAVICARVDEAPSGKLKRVESDDVVYVYARPAGKEPRELAELLQAEGLPHAHRDLKLFLSNSGGRTSAAHGAASYAERVYNRMKKTHPDLVVYGYFGEVSPRGFDAHKTAGLRSEERVENVTRKSWDARKLRAKENRIRFPPEPGE
jgi:hypothetical protein